MVEVASAKKMRLRRGMVWSGDINPARCETATSVPMLSKRSTKRKTKMISKAPMWRAPRMSRWNAVVLIAVRSYDAGCQ